MAAASGPDKNLAKLLKPVIAGLESGAVKLGPMVVDHGRGYMTIEIQLTGATLDAIGKTFAEREQRRLRVSTNPKVKR